jgi:hypothetical protein
MIPTELRNAVCRSLSKSGSLAAQESQLRALAPGQSKAEVSQFYSFLRDNAQRWEREWRSEFAAIFSADDGDLPSVDDADRWSSILHALIAQGDLPGLRVFLEGIGVAQWDLTPEFSDPTPAIYPIDDPDQHGESPIAKARRLGQVDIAAYLESTRETVVTRYRQKWKDAHAKKG